MNAYHDHTDAALVSLLLDGDEQAFEVVYFRYAKALYRYAHKRIYVKEDCQEIVQEVFESLWERHENISHVTLLEPYLYRMVKYKVIRYFQHSKVKQKFAEHFKIFEELIDTSQEEKEIESLRSLLNESLSKLPERCQMAVRLRIDENLSNGAIAERINIDKSTVKRYMTTALSYFREQHLPIYSSNQRYFEPD